MRVEWPSASRGSHSHVYDACIRDFFYMIECMSPCLCEGIVAIRQPEQGVGAGAEVGGAIQGRDVGEARRQSPGVRDLEDTVVPAQSKGERA